MIVNKITKAFINSSDFVAFLLFNPLRIEKFRQKGFVKHFKAHVAALNVIYTFFNCIFMILSFGFYEKIQFNIVMSLHIIQVLFPIVISSFVGVDMISERKMILALQLSKAFPESKILESRLKVFARLLVLVAVRIVKTAFEKRVLPNIAFALCQTVSELVASMNDFVFAFHVEMLALRIKAFTANTGNVEMNLENLRSHEAELENIFLTFRAIQQFYSPRIFLTVLFNFIQLIVSLYWIFIRVIFGYLRGSQYVTFLYIIQPALCLVTVFQSAEKCCKAVSVSRGNKKMFNFLLQHKHAAHTLFNRHKTTEVVSYRVSAFFIQGLHSQIGFKAVNIINIKSSTLITVSICKKN